MDEPKHQTDSSDEPAASPVAIAPEPELAAAAVLEEPAPAAPSRAAGLAGGAVAGALTAAAVLGGAWLWLSPQLAREQKPMVDAAAFDTLAARVAALETRPAPAAPPADPALASRLGKAEQEQNETRHQLAGLKAEIARLAAVPAATSDGLSAAEGAALRARLDKVEQIAASPPTPAPPPPPSDAPDSAARRALVLTALDAAVRSGEPFAALLAAAEALAPRPALDALAPFANTGVPSPAALGRELVAIPRTPADPPARAEGVMARLRAGAEKLVTIERTDEPGAAGRGGLSGVAAAAQRGDLAEARRLAGALDAADRAPLQPWLDRAAARDAALAASRTAAAAAVAALSSPVR